MNATGAVFIRIFTLSVVITNNPSDTYAELDSIVSFPLKKSSHESSFHLLLDIDAPTKLVTTDITESTATVTWDKVLAEIDGYVLTYTSADGSSQEFRVGPDATSYQFTSLKPGVLYTITIWAYKGSRLSKKSSTEAETGKPIMFSVWA